MPDMPEWVHVWAWLRFGRSILTPMPQQGINPKAMSMDEFETYRGEWMEEGSPRVTPAQIVTVVSGGKVPISDDIPF